MIKQYFRQNSDHKHTTFFKIPAYGYQYNYNDELLLCNLTST